MRRAGLLLVVSLCANPGFAQFVSSTASSSDNAISVRLSAGQMRIGTPVTGKPYSAERVTETVQTLGDGTHIRRDEGTEAFYRDSLGRTRMERSIGAQGGSRYVEITDPVAGNRYVLDDVNHVAHRMAVEVMQPTQARIAAAANGAGVTASARPAARPSGLAEGARPEVQHEDLGTQMIEGVSARGTRTTRTWPVDSIGNDKPVVATGENWFSAQIGMTVLSKNTDPRYGETTTALKNISLAEPDPSLFMPPAGYSVVDETGPFQISVARPGATATQ